MLPMTTTVSTPAFAQTSAIPPPPEALMRTIGSSPIVVRLSGEVIRPVGADTSSGS